MKVCFDSPSGQLVYMGESPSSSWWDEHWRSGELSSMMLKCSAPKALSVTRRLLPDGGRILEAGCGIGNNVKALVAAGYQAEGIDYAEKAISLVTQEYPDIQLRVGDVRELPYEGNYFDAVWSLGVIEHYHDPEIVVGEIARVLVPGGFCVITVPVMNCLRRWKARNGQYEKLADSPAEQDDFYQYAMTRDRICELCRQQNLSLLSFTPTDGLKGLKDEVHLLKPLLQRTYDSHSICARAFNACVDLLATPWAGHVGMFVFRKGMDVG